MTARIETAPAKLSAPESCSNPTRHANFLVKPFSSRTTQDTHNVSSVYSGVSDVDVSGEVLRALAHVGTLLTLELWQFAALVLEMAEECASHGVDPAAVDTQVTRSTCNCKSH